MRSVSNGHTFYMQKVADSPLVKALFIAIISLLTKKGEHICIITMCLKSW